MNMNEMTIGEVKELLQMFSPVACGQAPHAAEQVSNAWKHPMLGERVLVRTYSAGVHIGTLVSVNPCNSMECELKDAFRLWKWTDGGLSLSAIAHNGINGGRLNKTDRVVLTNAIEYIPTTPKAEESFARFVEDADEA